MTTVRYKRRLIQALVLRGDSIYCMYTEKPGIDVRKYGDVKRAVKVSDVVFNAKKQRWEAIDRKTKKIVAKNKSRAECVAAEHAHYVLMIAEGRFPWED